MENTMQPVPEVNERRSGPQASPFATPDPFGQFLSRYWGAELAIGVFWVVVALVVLKFNHASVVTVGVLTGLLLLLFAAEQFVLAATAPTARWLWAIFGVLLAVGGIVALIDPVDTFAGLADILGFIFLLIGVQWMVQAFAERPFNPYWWLTLIGAVLMVVLAGDQAAFGPSPISLPHLDSAVFWTAFTVLVIPQVPLSFANSCLATADAAKVYFGKLGDRVRPGRLATTFGSANLLAGAISGMPVCHGAGGMTAHYAFGARTAAAPAAMGVLLLTLALALGAGLAGLLAAFPLPILAGVLATAGVLHMLLLRDLHRAREWAVALLVGVVGFEVNLMVGLALGLALWWLPVGARMLPRLRTT